ncbi:hypothetical protein QQ045_006860 [Rhodiola kirilowii]
MACVSTSKFSVLINGGLEGYFSSSRGLRQGDLISPYLFTLIMEVLSRFLGKIRQSEEYLYHPKCAKINLSHQMFADDVIIFYKSYLRSVMKIKEALNIFSGWSGLEVNVNKSAIYFGGCDVAEKIVIAQSVDFQLALLLKQVWDLCLKKDSMWIMWMHSYFFNKQNLWELDEKNNHSWVLKNILRLRQDSQNCIQFDSNWYVLGLTITSLFLPKVPMKY